MYHGSPFQFSLYSGGWPVSGATHRLTFHESERLVEMKTRRVMPQK